MRRVLVQMRVTSVTGKCEESAGTDESDYSVTGKCEESAGTDESD